MKVVVQRVSRASVKVDNKIVGKIDNGFMLLVGFTKGDDVSKIDWMVRKISNLRVFDDKNAIMNLSIKEVGGSVLSISQFTLYGDCKKGNRPTYIEALGGEEATLLYDMFNEKLRGENLVVEEGIFGADMEVELVNDGPVTILLEK